MKLTFNDFGEVDLDKLECYKNIRRSDVFSPFVGEFGEVPNQVGEVGRYIKDGPLQTAGDSSGMTKSDHVNVLERHAG